MNKGKITINSIGDDKITAIKWVRSIAQMGLCDAKNFVESEMIRVFGTRESEGQKGKALAMDVEIHPSLNAAILEKYRLEIRQHNIGDLEWSKRQNNIDFTVSMKGDETTINFKGAKIEAKMTVESYKMLDVVKWVVDNF